MVVAVIICFIVSCSSTQERTVTSNDGTVIERFSYYVDDNGSEIKHGDWLTYYQNGNKRDLMAMVDGKHDLSGGMRTWYENGALCFEQSGDATKGETEAWRVYRKSGQPAITLDQSPTQVDYTYWDISGTVEARCTMTRADPEYDDQGNISKLGKVNGMSFIHMPSSENTATLDGIDGKVSMVYRGKTYIKENMDKDAMGRLAELLAAFRKHGPYIDDATLVANFADDLIKSD